MKRVSLLMLLLLIAFFAVGCCNNSPNPDPDPDNPDPPPPPPITNNRYITLWGNDGDAGATVTETPYEGIGGTDLQYTSITYDQVTQYYSGDTSNTTLFPTDGVYFYGSNSDLDQTFYVTEWGDGTTSYSLVPFGSHDDYNKVDQIGTRSETENINFTAASSDDEDYVQIMLRTTNDEARNDYEDTPSGENGEFQKKANSGAEQYL